MRLVRTFIFMLFCLILLSSYIYANEHKGFTLWGLNQKDFDSESTLSIRFGYESEDFLFNDVNNSIELFIGTSMFKRENTESGNLDPPTTLSLGGIYILGDLFDPNENYFWINPVLTTIFPSSFEARPYIGGEATWNFVDDDGGFFGGSIGLIGKANKKAKVEYIFELDYNNFFYDLSSIKDDDEFIAYVGLRIPF